MKKNNVIIFILGSSIASFLIYYSIKDFSFVKLQNLSNEINYGFIILSVFIMIFTIYIRALRWKILLNNRTTTNFLYKVELIGYFGNNILPFRMGEILRAVIVGQEEKISKSKVFGSIVLERTLDMLGAGFLLVIILISNPIFFNQINSYFKYAIYIMFIIGIIGLLFSALNNKNILSKYKSKYISIIKNIFQGFSVLDKENILIIILYTFFIWLSYLLNVYIVQYAFNLSLNIFQSSILLLISTAAIAIPSLPGNFGTFEGSIVYSLSIFNIVDDFGFSFILHGVSFIPYTFLGFIYFIEYLKIFRNKKIFRF